MKIDLNEHERKARDATQSEWRWGRPAEDNPERSEHTRALFAPSRHAARLPVIVLDADSLHLTLDADCQHIAANSPPVTLALIARIRELEAEVDRAAGLLEAGSDKATRRLWAAGLRESVKKGVVSP